MSNPVIERAEKSLAPQILALQKAAYVSEAELYGDFSIPPLIQTLSSLEADFGKHTFYIARGEGVLVGSVNVRIEGGIGYIGRLVVLPGMQKQGVGSCLLAHAERVHAKLDAFELFTGHKSERNIAFYQSRGYIEYRREAIHAGLTLVHMRKPSANNALLRTIFPAHSAPPK